MDTRAGQGARICCLSKEAQSPADACPGFNQFEPSIVGSRHVPCRNVCSDGARLATGTVSLHASPLVGTRAKGWFLALVFHSERDEQGGWSEPTVLMSSLTQQHQPGGGAEP